MKVKLSTLILEGCKLDGPKVCGQLFKFNKKGKVVRTCALGAAYMAMISPAQRKLPWLGYKWGWKAISEADNKLDRLYGVKVKALSPELAKMNFRDTLFRMVVELNDEKHWTRERIGQALKDSGY